jgi:hypothetical protein
MAFLSRDRSLAVLPGGASRGRLDFSTRRPGRPLGDFERRGIGLISLKRRPQGSAGEGSREAAERTLARKQAAWKRTVPDAGPLPGATRPSALIIIDPPSLTGIDPLTGVLSSVLR